MSKKPTILTGDRPTGPLHLGHYTGSLTQRVALQEDYEQFVLLADMQALTDNGNNREKVSSNILNVVADYLAVGIDPKKTTICLQSKLPALAELTMYYSNIVNVNRLLRNPTIKNEMAIKKFDESLPVGFLSYPVSQAADITAFGANLVPAGEDQAPMVELCNEIVSKLNKLAGKEVLNTCKLLLSQNGRLSAPDGRQKMSKSSGKAIFLGSNEKEISLAVKSMFTDPNHIQVDDPGSIEGNVVFEYLKTFHPDQDYVTLLAEHYQREGLGDGKTKSILNDCLQELLRPIREERKRLLKDQGYLFNLLREGTEKSVERTQNTLTSVKSIYGLNIF